MATNSLGGLVVSLGLNAVEFVSGLTKAEFEAQKFAKRFAAGIDSAVRGAAIGVGLIATAATAAVVAVDQLAKEAAKFKDLEEITGASAESLASFAVAAKVAGTDMNTVATASVKLTKGLTGVDDESKAAGAALAALGINIKEFKQLDPATQIDTIAKALAGFADGSAKTAVAVALFGKAGAELLPFLKELGDGIGRQTILTQAQIEASDKYADAQARATATLHLYLQVLATQALPVISAVTKAATEFITELTGLDKASDDLATNNGVEAFATNTARALAAVVDVGDALVRIFRIVNTVLTVGVQNAGPALRAILDAETFSSKLERQLADLAANRKLPGEGGGRRREAKTLVFSGAEKNAKALKEQTSEADRYLESLQKQLEKTLELTVVQQVSLDIEKKRIKGLTPDLQQQILAVAGQIDAYHRLQDEIKAINKAFDDQVRAQQAADKERERATNSAFDEAQAIADANNSLRDEIAIILGGETARKALEKQRIASAIAIKEEALAQLQLDASRKGEAAALQSQITLLKERAELLQGRDVAEQLARDARNLQEFKNIFADSAANAFTDFITGARTAKEAFKDFVGSVNRQISQIASQNIANAIFGGSNGQGFDLSRIVNQLTGGLIGTPAPTTAAAGAVGAGAATAADASLTALSLTTTTADAALGTLAVSAAANDAAFVTVSASAAVVDASMVTLAAAASTAAAALLTVGASSAASGLGSIFGSALGGMAQGGGLAGGTDFARGGRTLVGERGPEIVDLPPGSKVTANDQIGKMLGRPNLSIVVNVPQGTSGPSADQIGIRVGAHVQRALARNG